MIRVAEERENEGERREWVVTFGAAVKPRIQFF